jgi:hypothetical protein
MTQYKIPQKTQREDKILGPLTGKQLLYGMVTLGGSYVLFSMINLNPIFYFNLIERVAITIPFFMLGLAFTLVEVNERPFEIYFMALMNFLFTPKVRIWQKEPVFVDELPRAAEPVAEAKIVTPATEAAEAEAKVSRADIRRLSTLIDKPELAESQGPAPIPTRTLDMLSKLEKESKTETQPMQVLAKGDKKFNILNIFKPVQDMLFGGKPTGAQTKVDSTSAPAPTAGSRIAETQEPSVDELASLLQKKSETAVAPPPAEAASPPPAQVPTPHEVSIEDILNQHKQDKAGQP